MCVIVCLLNAQLQIFRVHQNVQHRNWYLYLCILCMRLRPRDVRGRNDLVVFLDATQERQKQPAALKLDVVCLCWHAWAVVLHPATDVYNAKKTVQAKKMLAQLLQNTIDDLQAEIEATAARDAKAAEEAGAEVGEAACAEVPHEAGGAQHAAVADRAGAAAGGAAGGDASRKRKSERISNSVQQRSPSVVLEEDVCERIRQSGGLSLPSSVKGVRFQGSFCWEGCMGKGGGCTNAVPDIDSEEWVQVSNAKGGQYGKYLTAKKRIPQGEMFTIFGGVIVRAHTDLLAYTMFTKIRQEQNAKAEGEPKFQYSTQPGCLQMPDSMAWLIPRQDIALLEVLLQCSKYSSSNLKKLLREQTQAQGLGQYVQHTCCSKHVNAYIFPMYIQREGEEQQRAGGGKMPEDEMFMDLQAVAIRAQKDIEEGEEILMHYVGLGRAGEFGIFDCCCCKCAGPCRPEAV